MRQASAALAVAWLAFAFVLEITTYLPLDPEWSLLPTAALFGSSFLVAAIGAFFVAPGLTAIGAKPGMAPRWFKWFLAAWAGYTLIWFVVLFTLPGVPTHCGTPGFPACGHTYVFDNHGSLTVTDRLGFLAGVRILVRVFASPPIAAMAVILAAYRVMPEAGLVSR